jgi:hypothetical protein
MSDMIWDILDEDEYKQRVAELETKCINFERVGYVTDKNGANYPSIRTDKRLFKKLVQAGSIDNTSRITTFNIPPYFYAKLEINWPTIKEKITIFLNGWRGRNWLEMLCVVKKVALTTQDFKASKPMHGAIVVDGINVDKLQLALVTSMFCPPQDALNDKKKAARAYVYLKPFPKRRNPA